MGLATISIAQGKIYEPSKNVVKDLQLERLDNSLEIKLKKLEGFREQTSTQPQVKPISDIAVNLVKEFEGFADSAYVDTDGTPVIGYGLSTIAGKPVQLGDRISPLQAENALKHQLQEIHQELDKIVQVNLSDRQFSALASISFNVGINSIKDSTLVKKINAEDYAGAANEFLRWDKANLQGTLVQMPGLTRRRQAERQLFLDSNRF
jgi:GH24 family phage-related lysozyme (muramidase)